MRLSKSAILAGLLFLGLSSLISFPAGAHMPAPTPGWEGHSSLVRIPFADRLELNRLASNLDVWEVHPDKNFLVARVSPEQFSGLLAAGASLEVVRRLPAETEAIPDFPCYRTIEELGLDLMRMASEQPAVAELLTIGSSYEGRPLWAIRLTNRSLAGDKPKMLLMANLHGREVITPEAAIAFTKTLISGYGRDADVTWLLDEHEIHVLVSANPDGHIRNEPGAPWAYWRKNTQPYGSCDPDAFGVDLNRNFNFQWGCCGGSSGDPCQDTFRGPERETEPETQAIQAYVRGLFPDQRGPELEDPAYDTTSGVVISLHSYGNLVLWPWGWTGTPAPNETGLAVLGKKMAAYNQYHPRQAYDLYIADGTSDDWVYGELGIPAYTFEIGTAADGFYPSCSRVEALIGPNLRAFIYAAKVARSPYLTAPGPDVVDLTLLNGTADYPGLVLTAAVDAANSGDASDPGSIASVELYVDLPPWRGGTPVPLEPVDGVFDETREDVQLHLADLGMEQGRHLLFIRGMNAAGYWGAVSAVFTDKGTSTYLPFLIIDGD